jgi:CO/xanthine dehydrogenase Mo-binding subunit
MTEMLNGDILSRELSRKTFVKGGGALIVGFSAAGAMVGASAKAAGPTSAGYNPDLTQVDSFLTLNADNTVTIKHGQPDWGHGIYTGIVMLVAEELDMDPAQVFYPTPDTWVNGTGGGGGSGGISTRAQPVRAAAVAARTKLLQLASANLGVPVSQLTVSKGVVSGGGKAVKYSDLLGGKVFSVTMNPTTLQVGVAPAKPVTDYKVVGGTIPRVDLPGKISGKYTYVQNIRIPGMLHARVVRPTGQGAVTSQNHYPVSVDEKSIKHIPGAKVVRVNNFLAVVAPKEYDAIQAAAQLKVTWKKDPKLPGSGNFWSWLRQAGDTNTTNPARYTTNNGNVESALKSAAQTLSATYKYQYNGHMSIGPTCAIADYRGDSMTVFCNSQQPSSVPTTLAGFQIDGKPYFGLPAKEIRCVYYEGASSFGGMLGTGGQTDAYIAAAVLSKETGKPVRLQWMRWDEHGWTSYGPAAMYDVKAGIDASGNITAVDWTSYGQAGTSLMPTSELVGFATWPASPGSGGPATSDTIYKVASANKRVLAKSQPLYGGAFKSDPLRAPGAPQSHFAGEQLVDELAVLAKMDPAAFRKQNIDMTVANGVRWQAALDTVTKISGWKPKVSGSAVGTGDIRKGRGLAFGTFANSQAAMVADVEVNVKSGKIVAKHLYIAHVNGVSINPDLVANQAEGAAIQGLSRALYERLAFNKDRITSTDWVTYPILRIKDAPTLTVAIATPDGYTVNVPGGGASVKAGNIAAINAGWATTGAGEPPQVPVGAAVANAFFDATGVRIREAPMDPDRVRAVLKAAGAK